MANKQIKIELIAVLLLTAAALYFGIANFYAKSTHKESTPNLSPEVLAQFFTTRLYDETGKPYAIEQWRGKVLVVNFWATWCPPCREEMPAFSRLQTKYAERDVQFVGIALDNANNVAQFKKIRPVSYPLLIAESNGSALTQQLGNADVALPYTVIFGKNGELRLRRLGRFSEHDLDTALQKASSSAMP